MVLWCLDENLRRRLPLPPDFRQSRFPHPEIHPKYWVATLLWRCKISSHLNIINFYWYKIWIIAVNDNHFFHKSLPHLHHQWKRMNCHYRSLRYQYLYFHYIIAFPRNFPTVGSKASAISISQLEIHLKFLMKPLRFTVCSNFHC